MPCAVRSASEQRRSAMLCRSIAVVSWLEGASLGDIDVGGLGVGEDSELGTKLGQVQRGDLQDEPETPQCFNIYYWPSPHNIYSEISHDVT
jgi:hypothetical protein